MSDLPRPPGPVTIWTTEQKIGWTLERSKAHLGPEFAAQISALVTPQNLTIMAVTLALWALSHFVGVGEVLDVIMLLVGAAMLGPAIVEVVEKLMDFGKCIDAQTDEDIERAAKAFAEAVVKGGITAVMAILLRKGAKAAQARVGAEASWLQVAKPKSPGLPQVGADPHAGEWWSKLKTTRTDALPPDMLGAATPFGDIFIRLDLTGNLLKETLLHELVHRAFTPRFILFRTLRVRMGIAGYQRSVILQAIEEALAESYAQMRMNGIKGIIKGIRFPVDGKYVSVQQLKNEGIAIGTVLLGAAKAGAELLYYVGLVDGPNSWGPDWKPAGSPRLLGPQLEVTGGFNVIVGRGSSLSDVARQYYGDVRLWPLIYDLNKARIGANPNMVKSGQVLMLLPLEHYTKEEMDAARTRAPSWKKHPH